MREIEIESSTGDLLSITAASLDDPSWFRLALDFYAVSAQAWDCMNLDLLRVAQAAPAHAFINQ